MAMFRVEDMTCGHCASTIARAVAGVDAHATVEVNIAQKLVRITSGPDAELASAIVEAGYTPQRVEAVASTAPRQSRRGCCCGPRTAAAAQAPAASCCGG